MGPQAVYGTFEALRDIDTAGFHQARNGAVFEESPELSLIAYDTRRVYSVAQTSSHGKPRRQLIEEVC